MQRFTLALALVALPALAGDLGGETLRRGAMSAHAMGSGFAAPPADLSIETFSVVVDENGPSATSDTLVIGDTTMTLVLSCFGSDESGTDLVCAGGTLSESGGAVSTTTETPWLDAATEPALNFDSSAGYFEAASSSLADLTTEDFVVELILRTGDNANDTAVCKINGAGTVGWRWTTNATGTHTLGVGAAGGFVSATKSVTLGQNAWSHAMGFVRRNELSGAVACVQGSCGTAAHTTSFASSSMSTSTNLQLGACGTLTHAGDAQIAGFRMWRAGCSDCLETSLFAGIALDRATQLEGLWPDVARGSRRPITHAGTSLRLTDMDRGDGVRKLYPMAAETARVARRKELTGGAYLTGYLSETAGNNKLVRSHEFNTTWTTSEATIDDNAAGDPYIDAEGDTADGVIGSVNAGAHYVTQSPTLSAAAHVFSVYAKAGAGAGNAAVVLYEAVGGKGACFNLSTCSFIDEYNGTTLTASGAEDWGDDWCRVWMTWTATAAATALRIYPSDDADSCAAADFDYTGDGSTIDVYLFGAQVESTTILGRPTNYVPTFGSAVTKGTDQLQFSATDNVPTSGANIQRWTILQPDVSVTGGSFYPAALEADSSNYMACRLTGSSTPAGSLFYGVVEGGSDVLGLSTTPTGYMSPDVDFNDGEIHQGACAFGFNRFYKYADGVQNDNGTPSGTPPSVTDISIGWIQAFVAGWPSGVIYEFTIVTGTTETEGTLP